MSNMLSDEQVKAIMLILPGELWEAFLRDRAALVEDVKRLYASLSEMKGLDDYLDSIQDAESRGRLKAEVCTRASDALKQSEAK